MTDNPLDSKEYVLDALDGFAFEDGPPGREDVPPTRTPTRKFIKRAKEKSASPGKRPRSATKGRTPKREALQRHRGFPPSVGECPRVLILGSAPCEMSLEKGQFYGNPRNHFWAVMAYAMEDPQFPMLDFETRCSVLRSREIALWNICDVFTRYKSSDATLHCEEYTDIAGLVVQHPSIRYILCNGTASFECMQKYDLPGRLQGCGVDVPVISKLPSTSPANAMADPVETKGKVWKEKLQEALGSPHGRE